MRAIKEIHNLHYDLYVYGMDFIEGYLHRLALSINLCAEIMKSLNETKYNNV